MKNDHLIKQILDDYDYDPKFGFIVRKSTGKVIKSLKHGYPVIQRFGKKLLAHRFIMFKMGHDIPYGFDVDHINGIRTDNRFNNLRIVDRSTNRRNTRKLSCNKSGITGVYWHKHNHTWAVKGVDSKEIGYRRDFFEACCLRKSYENEIGRFTERHGK